MADVKKGVPRFDIHPKKYKGPRPMREFRRRMKLTQLRAAEILGVTLGTYQVWESGRGEPPYYWRYLLQHLAGPGCKYCERRRGMANGAA